MILGAGCRRWQKTARARASARGPWRGAAAARILHDEPQLHVRVYRRDAGGDRVSAVTPQLFP